MGNSQPYFGLLNALKVRHITQSQAASIIGISATSFNLKSNRRKNRDFKLSEAKKLSEELKISYNDFF